MRNFLEYLSLLATVVGFTAAVAACAFCWEKASTSSDTAAAQFAIAGSILTGLLAIALAIYLKPKSDEE